MHEHQAAPGIEMNGAAMNTAQVGCPNEETFGFQDRQRGAAIKAPTVRLAARAAATGRTSAPPKSFTSTSRRSAPSASNRPAR